MNYYEVEYWVATYHGTITVWADDEDEAEAKAIRRLSENGSLPMGYRRFVARQVG